MELPDDSLYVAFRGTDNTITGWREDFNMGYLSETPGQLRAVEYLNRAVTDKSRGCVSAAIQRVEILPCMPP